MNLRYGNTTDQQMQFLGNELHDLSKAKLQRIASMFGCPTSGTKKVLVERIMRKVTKFSTGVSICAQDGLLKFTYVIGVTQS